MLTAQHKSQSFFTKTLYGYSVLMIEDGLGYGYIAQPTTENRAAMHDGWVLIVDGLRIDEACRLRDTFKDEEFALEYAGMVS